MKCRFPRSPFYDEIEEKLFEVLSNDMEQLLQFIRQNMRTTDARANAITTGKKRR
jgi:hypothetical protein